MSAKHTPGPWSVSGRDDPAVQVIGADGYGVGRAHTIGVAISGRHADPECRRSRSPEEAAANARLISAAPDLLAACEAVWLLTPFDSPERLQIVAAMHKAQHVEPVGG